MRLRRRHGGGLAAAGRQPAECGGHQFVQPVRLHGTGCGHQNMVGRIPGPETLQQAAARKISHRGARAKNGRAQRVSAPKVLRQHLVDHRFRIVFLHANLFEHHLPLFGDILGGKQWPQHHVGEHVKRQRQMFVQHLGVKAYLFFGGKRVQQSAHRIHLARNLFGGAPRCALEHHVLDKMRHAALAGGLASRAGVQPDANGNRAHMRHGLRQDQQAVRQAMLHDAGIDVSHLSLR